VIDRHRDINSQITWQSVVQVHRRTEGGDARDAAPLECKWSYTTGC